MHKIKGFATVDATAAHARRFDSVQHATLGRTGLHCSQAGFGGYRITDGVEVHRKALILALGGGINLIDTSANYADGASETLVGKVLADAIQAGSLKREEIVVVTKGGYLQGQNYSLSQSRKDQGRPFPDLVPYAEGLEHCIHPEFLDDQITRSLKRLNLATIDFYLLHNPEYYLGWVSSRRDLDPTAARIEYERRIQKAFHHLEQEVARGRIRYYGISSNTFPVSSDQSDFTCLHRLLDVVNKVETGHHFAMIQFPMNLIESGAVLNDNQPDGSTLLATAIRAGLGTLINRPLNAMAADGLMRLADVTLSRTFPSEAIDNAIQALMGSENDLAQEILPHLEVSEAVRERIEAQNKIGPFLLQQHSRFVSYDHWRQVMMSQLLPRVNGVLAYLEQQALEANIHDWAITHRQYLAEALDAVTSIYAESAARRSHALNQIVANADDAWEGEGTLSQMAIRAIRTTQGISSVLVGMRQTQYVADILQELRRFKPTTSNATGWRYIRDRIREMDRF